MKPDHNQEAKSTREKYRCVIRDIAKYLYRTMELFLILAITYGIATIGIDSHDNAEMTGLLSPFIVAIVWCWFVTLPFIIIIIASFIRAIPPKTLYKKVVLSIHIFNLLLWLVFYLILPEPTPCDAAIMEQHYKKHKKEMEELRNYVHAALDDSCSIVLLYRNEKIEELRLENKRIDIDCSKKNKEQELASELSKIGITTKELSVIREKMRQAGIIGIEIDKNCNTYSDDKDILLFRWYGVNKYQFAIYNHALTEGKYIALNQFILYNDSVVFESYGGYPGGRGFPDKERFERRITRQAYSTGEQS